MSADEIMITGDVLELITTVTAATVERLGAAACSVALLDAEQLIFVAATGVGAAAVIGMRLPVSRGLAGWVVSSGQAIAVADVHADRRFDVETAEATGYVPTSILAVPIEDDEGPIGVLEVLDRTVGPADLTVAAQAARQVALVRALALARSRLDEDLSDPELTDLVELLRRLRSRTPSDRALAVRLLHAVVDPA